VGGKKLIELAEVSNKKEDEVFFLEQEYSGLYDNEVLGCIECYFHLPETPHLDQNPLNYAQIAAAGQTTACSTSKIFRQPCQLTPG
jgi:hypothetical protein